MHRDGPAARRLMSGTANDVCLCRRPERLESVRGLRVWPIRRDVTFRARSSNCVWVTDTAILHANTVQCTNCAVKIRNVQSNGAIVQLTVNRYTVIWSELLYCTYDTDRRRFWQYVAWLCWLYNYTGIWKLQLMHVGYVSNIVHWDVIELPLR